MSAKDGGPAFPRPYSMAGGPDEARQACWEQDGMSLRDWFAGMALIGLASACNSEGQWTGEGDGVARVAFKIADAMLTERVRT